MTAELSHASGEATTITVSAAAVSPALEADFTLSANTTLTIAAEATTSTGTVTIDGTSTTTLTHAEQASDGVGGRGQYAGRERARGLDADP